MSEYPMINGTPLTMPTLLLDIGSRRTAALLALPEKKFHAWPSAFLNPVHPVDEAMAFLKASHLPMPELTLLCSMNASSEKEEAHAARMTRWRDELRCTGGNAAFSLKEELPGWEVSAHMSDAKKAFGSVLGADSGMAAVLFALSLENIRDRSWQEGITVIWAGEKHIQVFMIYQEKLLGLYEQHTGIPRDALLADLNDLRLNWLPDEKVRAEGGHGCICGNFPAEAEGFHPTWIFGPKQHTLQGMGKLFTAEPKGYERCFGLLFGLAIRELT